MAWPTRKVAGSPTRVSSPAALESMAVRIMGPTKSTSSSSQTRMITGARRITVVALGRMAQTRLTRAVSSSRKRRPLPRVITRKRTPRFSNTPVGASTRATTMPPNSSDSEPSEAVTVFMTSLWSTAPARVRAERPRSPARVMSRRLQAMQRITAPKTRQMA